MRFRLVLLSVALSESALGQAALPPRPAAPTVVAPPASVAPPRRRDVPEARRGFQMHLVPLTGVLMPLGDATKARRDSLGSRYGWQWMPLEIGLGAKFIDELYIGGYLNVGVGSEGSDLQTAGRCEAGNDFSDDVACSADSVRLGIEARYTFTPQERMSGWIGYGAGITNASQTISDAGRYQETTTASGIEVARVTGGLDMRLSRGFGLGPFVMASIGRYGHQRTEINDAVSSSVSIDDPAFHLWLGLGLRMVIFP